MTNLFFMNLMATISLLYASNIPRSDLTEDEGGVHMGFTKGMKNRVGAAPGEASTRMMGHPRRWE